MSLNQFQMICGDTHMSLKPSHNSPQLDMLLLGLHVSNAAVFSVASTEVTTLTALHDEFLKEIRQRGLKLMPLLGCINEPSALAGRDNWSPWVMVLGLEPAAAQILAKRYRKVHVLVYKYGFTLEYLKVGGFSPALQ